MNAQSHAESSDAAREGAAATGAPDRNDQRPFSLSITGWASLLGGAVLLALFAYFVVIVVPPMTRPSPYFEQLTQRMAHQATADGARQEQEDDELSVDLAVILEYANADIRALNVQVAFSLVGGLALTVIGILLFAVEARDAIKFSGGHHDWRWNLSATAPGSVALILGTVVMLTGIAKDTRRPLDASIRRPDGVRYEQKQRDLPQPGVEPRGTGGGAGTPDGSTPEPPGGATPDPTVPGDSNPPV